jgi:hypothetical protein
MHIPEWSYARQYGKTKIMEMGELWISVVDAYSGVDVCTLIFLVPRSFLKNLQNSNGHNP